MLPAPADAQTAVGATSSVLTATVTIATAGTLSSINVLTQGAANKDFQYASGGTCAVGTSYAANATCTVEYTFAPTRPGQRLGGIVLMGASAPIGQTPITGVGTGPLAEFPGSTAVSAVGSGFSEPEGVAVDGSGNVFVVDSSNSAVKEIEAGTGGNAAGVVSSSSTVVTVGSGFAYPSDVKVDGSGNVFVADTNNNAVKEIEAGTGGNAAGAVSSSSAVVTVGSGFSQPIGVAVDGSGNVFVADTNNNAVKEIEAGTGGNAAGVVSSSSTVVTVGSGFNGPEGVAVDGSGNVFVADTNNSAVKEIEAGTGGNPAGVVSSSSTVVTVGGGFNEPDGVAVDSSGNVFVADYGNTAVYEIEAGTGGNAAGVVSSSSTVVTVGSGFNGPAGVAVDGSGHVFVTDNLNHAVYKIDLTAPPALSFASTAVGNTSSDSPKSVTVQNAGYGTGSSSDATDGNLSFSAIALGADPDFTLESGTCSTSSALAWGTNCMVTASFSPVQPGSLSSTITLTDDTGNASAVSQNISLSGTATAATGATAQTISFPQPSSPALPGTSVTLTATADSGLPVLYSVVSGPGTVSGSTLTYTGTGTVVVEADQYGNNTYAPATAVQRSVAVQVNDTVGSSSSTLTATVTIATAGTLSSINVLTQGAANQDFQYAGGGTCAVGTSYAANATCTVEYTFTPTRPGQRMGGIVLMGASAPLGQTPITGTGTGPLAEFPGSTAVSTVGSGFSEPDDVAVDGSGNVFVADTNNHAVKEIEAGTGGNAAGVVSSSSTVVTVGSGFSSPEGVVVDGSGNVFVVDFGNSAVKEIEAGTRGNAAGVVSSSSTVVTVGSGFNGPAGVTVDGSGNVFVADLGNNAVKEIEAGTGGNAAGVVSSSSTVVPVGSGFHDPYGVAVDGSGNVFVADSFNSAVKEIEAGTGGNPAGVVSSSSTVVTVGSGFTRTYGVAVDGSGNVFVTTLNNAVKEIEAGTGGNAAGVVSSSSTVVTVGSGFSRPTFMAVDGSGHVFVADTLNNAAKEIDLTAPPALSFASTAVGNTSSDSPKSVTVQNAGNADLSITVPPTGTNPSVAANFSLAGASTCPSISTSGPAGSLPQNGLCTYAFNFTPTMAGSISGSAVLTDNTLSGLPQNIPLSGTGIAPLAITPSPALTGNALAATDGVAINETFTVSGGSGSGYTLSSTSSLPGGLTLTPSGSATGASWTLSGTPVAAAGSYSFSLTATDGTYTTDTVTQNYTLVVSAGAPYAVTASAGTPQSAYVNEAFATALTATVTDAYGDGVSGLTVSFTAPASGASAALSSSSCLTAANGSCSVTATANGTAGSYSVTASANGLASVSFALTNNPPPNLVVNETGDDAGNASDCSAQPSAGTTTNSDSCTLRDALAAASAAGAGNITFDNTVFATAQTIMLANGTLTIPNNTTITGPTAAGAVSANNPQGNLVTVDGSSLTNLSIFAINSGSTAAIANLVVQSETPSDSNCIENQGTFSFSNSALLNWHSSSAYSSLDNTGTLTVTGSTFANDWYGILNEAGATATVTGSTFATVFQHFRNDGTATISYSTFKGSSPYYLSGTIYTYGSGAKTTLLNSTVYGTTNTQGKIATPTGGAVLVSGGGTLNLGNSIVYGNTYSGGGSTVPSDVYVVSGSTLNDLGGNYIGTETGATTTTLHSASVNLSAFGSQGGNGMAVLLPLPGSPAICAGVAANIPNGATTDQRGLPNKNTTYTGYSAGTPCVDAGAVQTDYSLKFDQQPSSVAQNIAMSPAPTVELDESGRAFADGTDTVSIPLALTTGAGTLTGGSATTSTTTGTATYPALSIDTLGTGDVLTATLALNPAIATNPPTLTTTSNAFSVGQATPTLSFAPSPASQVYGTAIALGSLDAAATYNSASVQGTYAYTTTVNGGTVTLTPGVTVLPVGSYTITATFTPSTNSVYTGASATSGYSVTAAPVSASVTAANKTYNGTTTATITGCTLTGVVAGDSVSCSAASASFASAGAGDGITVTASGITLGGSAAGNYALSSTTATTTANITQGALTITASNATRVYGTANPTFAGTITGQQNGDTFTESFSTAATLSSPVGSYPIVPSVTGANLSDYTQAITDGTLTVTQAASMTTLQLSSTSITPGQSVTLTATVADASAGSTGTPTGAVNFYDGTTLLSTVTLSGGVASYSTTALAGGVTHTLTATYSGDTNFTASSSTASASVAVAPLDFTMTISGPTTATVVPGSSITYQVKVTPDYGSYPGTVNFAISGLPSGATATFSPSSIAANGGPQTVTVTIQTAPATALERAPAGPTRGRHGAPFALALLTLFGLGGLRKRGRALRRMLCVIALLTAGAAATFSLSGCGSNSGFFAQAEQNYTVTITATAGSLQHTAAVTLNVQ